MGARTLDELSASFSKICRVCLAKTSKLNSLFSDVTLPRNSALIGEVIMVCASVQIKENDGLPGHVCRKCMEELRRALKFKLLCETSDAELRRQLAEVQEKAGADADEKCTRQCEECKIGTEHENPVETEARLQNYDCYCLDDEKKSVEHDLSPASRKCRLSGIDRTEKQSSHLATNVKSDLSQKKIGVDENHNDLSQSGNSDLSESVTEEIHNSEYEDYEDSGESSWQDEDEDFSFENVGRPQKLPVLLEENPSMLDQASLCFRPPGMRVDCFCKELEGGLLNEKVEVEMVDDLTEEDLNDGWMKLERVETGRVKGKKARSHQDSIQSTKSLELRRLIKSRIGSIQEPIGIRDQLEAALSIEYSIQSEQVDIASSRSSSTDGLSFRWHEGEISFENVFVGKKHDVTCYCSACTCDKKTLHYKASKQVVKAYYPTSESKLIINPSLPVRTVYMCHEIKKPDLEIRGKSKESLPIETLYISGYTKSADRANCDSSLSFCNSLAEDLCIPRAGFIEAMEKTEGGSSVKKKRMLSSQTKVILKCDLCNQSFASQTVLNMHMENTHDLSQNFQCELCGCRFSAYYALANHKRTHVASYKCNVCHKKFFNSAKLSLHKKTHGQYGKAQKEFVCSLCFITFGTERELKAHRAVHKPHKCSVCGHRFRFKCNLTDHMNKHADMKMFKWRRNF